MATDRLQDLKGRGAPLERHRVSLSSSWEELSDDSEELGEQSGGASGGEGVCQGGLGREGMGIN